MEDLPDKFPSELGSRIAYGEDARLLENTHFDHAWGKAFASGLAANVEKIQAEVTRRLRLGIELEWIKMAAEDAMEKRRPRC